MSTLQSIRNATLLARLVLVWLVLVTGVAIASPLAQPKSFALGRFRTPRMSAG